MRALVCTVDEGRGGCREREIPFAVIPQQVDPAFNSFHLSMLHRLGALARAVRVRADPLARPPLLRAHIRLKRSRPPAAGDDIHLSPWFRSADPLEILSRFEAVYGVKRIANYATLGTPKKTVHGCTVHLPLPHAFRQIFGVQRLKQRGDVLPRKQHALRSAAALLIKDLREGISRELETRAKQGKDCSLLVKELRRLEDGLVGARSHGPVFDDSDWFAMLRRFDARNDPELREALLRLSVVSEAPLELKRSKTLTKQRGALLQVTGSARLMDGGKVVSSVRAPSMDAKTGATTHYATLERAAIVNCGNAAAIERGSKALSDEYTQLCGLASARVAVPVLPGGAYLRLDATQLAPLAPVARAARVSLEELTAPDADAGQQWALRAAPSPSSAPAAAAATPAHAWARSKPSASSHLPIHALRDALLARLGPGGGGRPCGFHQLALVEGGTGSGKTTQVPNSSSTRPSPLAASAHASSSRSRAA